MSRNEYLREIVKGELDATHIREMLAIGWKPRAVEWEREVTAAGDAAPRVEDVPYGLQIAPDCGHLEENPDEMRILFSMMELVVQDDRNIGLESVLYIQWRTISTNITGRTADIDCVSDFRPGLRKFV